NNIFVHALRFLVWLPKTNRRHLRERSDRLGMTATDALDAGHERCCNSAEPRRENAKRAGGWANVGRCHELNLLSTLRPRARRTTTAQPERLFGREWERRGGGRAGCALAGGL